MKSLVFKNINSRPFLLAAAFFIFCGLNNTYAQQGRRIIDDFESGLKGWSGYASLGETISLDSSIVYSGSQSLKWAIEIKDAFAQIYSSWLWISFSLPQDWSSYQALEFYLYTDSAITNLSYAIEIDHNLRLNNDDTAVKNSELLTLDLCPLQEAGKPGWKKVIIPLDNLSVAGGHLRKVTRLLFYFSKDRPFYKQMPSKVNYYFDDISLVRADMGQRLKRYTNILNPHPSLYPLDSDFIIYPVYPLEFIYADSDLYTRKPVVEFSLRAGQGEIKPLTFAVFARDAIEDMNIKLSDLVCDNCDNVARIDPAESADIRVVKIWEQSGVSWQISNNDNPTLPFLNYQKVLVPELLLKDDRKLILDGEDGAGGYKRPVVLSYPFGTNIPAGTLKQIWINFSIPDSQLPGVYHGNISFSKGDGEPFAVRPVAIEVLPFKLPSAKLNYGTYYPWRLSGNPKLVVTEDLYLKDLKEMKRCGMESIYIDYGIEHDETNLNLMLAGIKSAGLKGPIVINIGSWLDIDVLEADRRISKIKEVFSADDYFKNIKYYIYGVDEPHSEDKYNLHKWTSVFIHDYQEKAMTAIFPSVCQRLKIEGEGLDWANLSIVSRGVNPQYIDELRKGILSRTAPFMTHYWQFYEENPTRNRMLSGFYLWQSGLDGAFPFGYQNWSPKYYSPYNNNIIRADGLSLSRKDIRPFGDGKYAKFFNVVYPSLEGPVSTLQWEGFRQGVNDVRYLTYLESLIEKLRADGRIDLATQAENAMKELLVPFSILPSSINVRNDPYILPKNFEEAREQLITLILRLELTNNSLSPASGSSLAGEAVDFTTTFINPDGYQDIRYVSFIISNPFSKHNSFYVYYELAHNRIFLRNDDNSGWVVLSGSVPGSANILENSYVKIDCAKTQVFASGNKLKIIWNVTFKPSFIGSKKAYLYAKYNANFSGNWKQQGIWVIK
jgi:hypothetical protein